tara:strand:- start:859 stop:1062 length:204 start_codon:yes stop_codon:yes gene_type:complete
MPAVTISSEKLDKVLFDVETLIEDVASLIDQDKIAKDRLEDIKKDPSVGLSENEIDSYLKKRGVKIE